MARRRSSLALIDWSLATTLGLLVVACSITSSGSATPTPTGTGTENPPPSGPDGGPPEVDRASPTASPEPVTPTPDLRLVGEATLSDGDGDLLDLDDHPAPGPDYIDVTGLLATADGTTLQLELNLAASVPPQQSTAVEVLNYTVIIYTDGATDFTHWIGVGNRETGDYWPALNDWTVTHEFGGPDFPGSLAIDSSSIFWTVPLAALGDPRRLQAGVWTQRSSPGVLGDVTAEDWAPDGGSIGVTPDWLTIGP